MLRWFRLSLLTVATWALAVSCKQDDGLSVSSVCAEHCDAEMQCATDGGAEQRSFTTDCREDCESDYAEEGSCKDERLAWEHCYYPTVQENSCDWSTAEASCVAEFQAYSECGGMPVGGDY